jgi:hypothetical protein
MKKGEEKNKKSSDLGVCHFGLKQKKVLSDGNFQVHVFL